MNRRRLTIVLAAVCTVFTYHSNGQVQAASWDPFLDTLQHRTIQWFLHTADPVTGLIPDRYPSPSPASIAAVGFGLTVYPIAVERGMMERRMAAQSVLNVLLFFWDIPQHDHPVGVGGYRGLFYHFLDMHKGTREWACELSTVDTGLLMAGVLFCQSYFDKGTQLELSIRHIADSLYRRVDWQWSMGGADGIRLSWRPEQEFTSVTWHGYNEAMIMYILALGSPTHPVPPSAWDHWTSTYHWLEYYGQAYVSFGPLFGHQYSHCWIDYRGIQDGYMREKGIDYFENSRRATLTHWAYAKENPDGWRDYSSEIWGWTACDGPGPKTLVVDGRERSFSGYAARGVSLDWRNDDGTIAPTAAASSLPFTPEICVPAVKAMASRYGPQLWGPFGFVDAFNPTFITRETPNGWFDKDYLGIDQGPIVLMIENARNGFVWNVMKKNPYLVAGLRKAGFNGGWLTVSPSR